MIDDIENHRMRRLVRLDYHLALLPFSSGTATHLLHELETAFKRPEIREREHVVGIEYSHSFYVVEVETFGNHLGADKDVCLTVFKLVEDKLIAVFRARGVEVEASAASLRDDGRQVFLNTFSAETMHLKVGAMTRRTFRRHRHRIAAVVAFHDVLRLVIRHRDITVDALRHPMTDAAFETQRETSAVLEQNHLILVAQRVFHRIDEHTAEVSLHEPTTALNTHVVDDDFRHLHTTEALQELHEMITPLSCVVVALKRRRSGTKNDIGTMETSQNH